MVDCHPAMKHHLLIVEDDEFVQALLAAYLDKEGFKTSLAFTGKEMHAVLDKEAIDLILLDLTLPDEDGLTLARQVRSRSSLPIIVLTVRKGRGDRLAALTIGADDYLTKPVDPEELALRVRNLLDRAGTRSAPANRPPKQQIYRFEGWILDVAGHTFSAPDGGEIHLTSAEFNLLAALVKAPNRVLNRAYLLDAVSRDEDAASERMIDVLVSRLRKKIERDPRNPEIIVTVTGCGYKFAATLSS